MYLLELTQMCSKRSPYILVSPTAASRSQARLPLKTHQAGTTTALMVRLQRLLHSGVTWSDRTTQGTMVLEQGCRCESTCILLD
jgi:hypothetical protein